MDFLNILYGSLVLIFSFQWELYEIILLSLKISGTATIISTILGTLTAYLLVIFKNVFFRTIYLIISSLMGIPPVVVGLIVYYLFVESGPLGILSLLYTPSAMIIAQTIIVFPIVSSLFKELFDEFWSNYKDPIRSQNLSASSIFYLFYKNSSSIFLTIVFTGFGRAISEVGAVMIVGGNIEHYTRTMTTAISLETSMGNLQKAISMGIVLIIITILINIFIFRKDKRKVYN